MTFTGMVYAGKVEGEPVTLGVSGRLLGGNLVMWDRESNSLWSQIRGEGLFGEATGRQLDLVPSVIVGFATWKKMHPGTRVLDLPPIERTGWHFTTEHLASGKNERDQDLGIGARAWGDALMVTLERLQRDGVVLEEIAGTPVAFVWIPAELAALVYERKLGGEKLELALQEGALVDGQGRRFDALTGLALDDAAQGQEQPRLVRFSYVPSVVSAWEEFHPGGRILR